MRHLLCYKQILQGVSLIVLYADTARCISHCVICRYCKVRHTLCYMQILQGASHIVLYAYSARCVTHCVLCMYFKVRHTLCYMHILQGASHIVLYSDTARCLTHCVICSVIQRTAAYHCHTAHRCQHCRAPTFWYRRGLTSTKLYPVRYGCGFLF